MGIFDIFGNSDASNAANAQISGYENAYNQLVPLLNQGTSALSQYYGAGQNQLQNNANAAAGALTGGAGTANNALNTNAGNAIGALNQQYGSALAPSQQQYATGVSGQTQLGNLLGLNGPNGSAQAQQTLQNLPGYQFALNQGTQNVLRNQSATGQLNSGATNTDLTNYSQGLASQNYNNYLSQLQPYMSTANTAAGNIGSLYSGLGNQQAGTYNTLGQNLAGVATGTGSNLANSYNTLGSNLNQNYMGLGNNINQNYNTQGAAAYGTQVGIGNAQANQYLTQLAQSGSIFGGLTSLLGNALGAKTGGTGSNNTVGGSLGSGLSSLLGGLFGSDARIKEDIRIRGKLANVCTA